MGQLSEQFRTLSRDTGTREISQRVSDTYGDNPCDSLKLRNQDTGEDLEIPCDGKRCEHCSPRKILTMRLQLAEAFGEYTYILRTSDPSRHIARLKKQNDRKNLGWLYQSVGDDHLGYILISNLPIEEGQRRTSLGDWLDRVIHNWLYGDSRIRRTHEIGRLSLFTYRKRVKKGTDSRSPWARLSRRLLTLREIQQQRVIDERDRALEDAGLDRWVVWDDPSGRTMSSISMWRTDVQ